MARHWPRPELWRTGGKRRRAALTAALLLVPAYAWLMLAVFLPLGAMLIFSFLAVTPFGSHRPLEFTLKHYRAFVDRPYLVHVALVSLELGAWTTGICALVGLPTALALAGRHAARAGRFCFSC